MAKHELKRSLTLPLLTLYGLGTILGAGIYVLVGKVAGEAGIYAPIAFLISAGAAAFTGYSYAQLSTRYPRSAGEAVYVSKAFSWRHLPAIVGWLVIATGAVSAATLANGFAGYLTAFTKAPTFITISLVLAAITFISIWGIAESVGLAAIITVIEILGLLIVIVMLGDVASTLPARLPELLPPADLNVWLAIMLGAFLAFYAFIGFEDIVNVAEEVIEPKRVLPLSILISLFAASVLYFIISIIAVLSLPIDELRASEYPMISLLEGDHPMLAKIVGVISLVAIINGALVQVIMGSRMLYGMGIQKFGPSWLADVSKRTQTPVRATLLMGGIIWILALGFPCLLYTSPSPRDRTISRMPSSA